MATTPAAPPAVPGPPSMTDVDRSAIALAAYNQNFETFRSLNALMWQIPLIAMTLTGGLWFGVSKVETLPTFQLGLLVLATAGNIGLIFVLGRLRHIIGEYLKWLDQAFPAGHVSANGTGWATRNRTVRTVFQLMLGFAALISFVLTVSTVLKLVEDHAKTHPTPAVAYYDAHAEQLADGYEGLDADRTHPRLFDILRGRPSATIVDVGAGTGRDASAIAALGHRVVAVEPSPKMLALARRLHPARGVTWIDDSLPDLALVGSSRFDVVMLSAVWMHVPPYERSRAFERLVDLCAPGGMIYMTLRLGPDEAARGMFAVDGDEVRRLAGAHGLRVEDLGRQPDLLGRSAIAWDTLMVTKA